MYVHNDELLFDPLPQPYRFVNKVLLKCIEDAIDLAEGGGSAESLNAFVCHNLRLTKVGKIPTQSMEKFFLSTLIANHEITHYQLLGQTNLLVVGTTQGNIVIFNPETQESVYSLNITTLSKFAQQKPIIQLINFPTDHENYVVAMATDDIAFMVFLSSQFVLRTSIEIDISCFSVESMKFETCAQPFLILTDGNGRTSIYNCHTPPELVPSDNATQPTKAQQSKPIVLEPVLEIEKCPISTGPVTSETQLIQKTEDTGNKKRPVKKKPAPPAKGKGRAKSPGTIAVENATPIETTKYHASVFVFDNIAVLRFGTFPVLLTYNLTSPNVPVHEFPLPSPVSTALELNSDNHVVLGFENGSFCFLNVARGAIHDHQFPRQGPITEIRYDNNILYTFTHSKSISAYVLNNFKVVQTLYTCSDDDILQTHVSYGSLCTYNQKSADLNIFQALSHSITWEDREILLFPNLSVLKGGNGAYTGTVATPVNLDVIKTLWNDKWAVFIYNDPVEFRTASPNRGPSPLHGKRGASPKVSKPAAKAPPKGKVSRSSKKQEEQKVEEQEATVVVKRQIIAYLDLEESLEQFNKLMLQMEMEKTKRRTLLKSMSSKSVPHEEVQEVMETIQNEDAVSQGSQDAKSIESEHSSRNEKEATKND